MTSQTRKVFLTGATGVLGRRALPRLVEAGHQVTAIARSSGKAAMVEAYGATAVQVDLFDAVAVRNAVAGHDAVVNLATHIPSARQMARPGAWKENARIRTEGSRHLVDAALAAGVGRFVQESLGFVYADAGDGWVDEDSPVEVAEYAAAHVAEAEVARFANGGGAAVVLRFGMFHGAESEQTQLTVALARRGFTLALGRPGAYMAMIEVDDAARAVVASLHAAGGIYNIVDDEPLTRRDYADALAGAIGRSRPLRLLPAAAARVGGEKTALLARSERVSNARFKEATAWEPRFRSAREAWPAIVGDMAEPAAVPASWTFVRVALAFVASGYVLVGAWALGAPRSFYDSFPGGGRAWVSGDGPFNEHLVRDVGALNLAVAFLLIVAAWRGGRTLVRTAAGAGLIWALPHFVYHAGHLDALPSTADRVANLVSLGLSVVAPVAVLWITRRWSASTATA